MRILIVGAGGTIGQKVSDALGKKHEIIKASRTGGDVSVDITSSTSIEEMFKTVENIDACVCVAGPAKFAALDVMTEEDVYVGIRGKLMGQVNLVRIGQRYLNDGGSFTLTTGILAEDPIKGSAPLSLVNGAIHSFALAAAQELARGIRINVVCPTVVEDSAEKYADFFAGFDPAPMHRVVNGYIRSVEGLITGRIIKIY
jgi:NAD(P)-dependent dehydrogenase (short-subunit alcohol dehydrogenase family)